MQVPAEAWRAWAAQDHFIEPLRGRIRALGLGRAEAERLIQEALAISDWRGIARLDAALRMSQLLEQPQMLAPLIERAREEPGKIPARFWSAREDGEGFHLRGAVMLRVEGYEPPEEEELKALPQDLAAALKERPEPILHSLIALLFADGLALPLLLSFAALLGSAGVVFEGLLFRGLLEIHGLLGPPAQRIGALAVFISFLIGLLLLEAPLMAGLLKLGRRLELRLRLKFRQKIPRLGDRYFHSRLAADLAERAQSLTGMRGLPGLAASLIRALSGLSLTCLGIIWLDPEALWLVLIVALLSVLLPFLSQPLLTERDLKQRTLGGGLLRFHLDALLGQIPLRSHGAGGALEREHDQLLGSWLGASRALLSVSISVETFLSLMGMALTAWLLLDHLERAAEPGGVLLLVYWALALPGRGKAVAGFARSYPGLRNTILRLFEPLRAPEEEPLPEPRKGRNVPAGLKLEKISVQAGGRKILKELSFELRPGEHLAVVGPSGAGKSTLLGLLLGWYRVADGQIFLDGEEISQRPSLMRQQIAWVDPSLRIWNRSLLENLRYGNPGGDFEASLRRAGLGELLQQLPEGLRNLLGEGGALVSGGQGQRVRLGRAFLKERPRLVLLDEPFRGLGADQRRSLMRSARRHWAGSSLICVTHDLEESRNFDRVLVIEEGRSTEQGSPKDLKGGAYERLLKASAEAQSRVWGASTWRRLHIERGQLREEGEPPELEDLKPFSPLEEPEPLHIQGESWPSARLPEALKALARAAGLPIVQSSALGQPEAELQSWMERAVHALGLEPIFHDVPYRMQPQALSQGPSLWPLKGGEWLAILGGRAAHLRVLGPDGQLRWRPREEIRAQLNQEIEAEVRPEIEEFLEGISLNKPKLLRRLLDEFCQEKQIRGCLSLRLSPGSSLLKQLQHYGILRRLWGFLGVHFFSYLLSILAWWLLGHGALSGRFEAGWLWAWGLLLLSQIPLGLAAAWWQGLFGLGFVGLLQRRVLRGGLQISSDFLRREGAGQLLGRATEAQRLSGLALSASFSALSALLDLGSAALVLSLGVVGLWHVTALGIWSLLALGLGIIYYRSLQTWTTTRMDLNQDLVERMMGHRTRLAQLPSSGWHEGEDALLSDYLRSSKRMDHSVIALTLLLTRGWLPLGIGLMAPALLGAADSIGLAVSLGGVLLASAALGRLGGSLAQITGAIVTWKQAGPLISAGRDQRSPPADAPRPQRSALLLEARELIYRFPGRPNPALEGASLQILPRDRLLLQGGSGGGKSTFAALLAGLRRPDAGLLLLRGLDLEIWGTREWSQRIALAPQFHENHILTSSLAFNLLMGRRWPPSPDDLEEAQEICEELGLGPLLERMPSGIQQVVGETGWRLSHGEQSRVFLARALLQDADLLLLDESFAALDPESLQRAMKALLCREQALLLIAHP